MKTLRLLLAAALVLLPLAEASAGSSTITTKDASGVTKTFFVTTDGSGNFYSAGVICDQSAAATCASVGTAGSPSTNALTIQAVTLGHGVAANAIRVELPTDGTGLVTVTGTGTAGSAATGVVTVQGIASGTVIPVSVSSSVGLAQGSSTSGQTGSLVMGAVTTAAPSYTTAQTSPASLTTAGDLRTVFSNTTLAVTNAGTFATQAASTQTGTWTVQPGNTANTTAWLVNQGSPYPSGATPYTATATGTTGATTATLAGASSVTTYLCGFSIRANATAAATNNATVTGVITATMNFTQWTAPLASGLGITEMIFAPCIPASTTNQSIAVVSGAPGSGGVVSVSAWGYKL